MTAVLLDVNVLIALMWPAHEGHGHVQEWFGEHAGSGWATCPFTEAAFVGIVANPAFSRDAVTPPEAIKLLAANTQHKGHQFWSDEIGFAEATREFENRLTGHQQVTDAYLLGLAMHRKGKLATMDKGVSELLAERSLEREFVVMI